MAPLTPTKTSPALISRGSPWNWRFHAPEEPPLIARTIKPGSVGRPVWSLRPIGTLGHWTTITLNWREWGRPPTEGQSAG
eukprot:10698805-Alexandrium_andersonii.AAC.1